MPYALSTVTRVDAQGRTSPLPLSSARTDEFYHLFWARFQRAQPLFSVPSAPLFEDQTRPISLDKYINYIYNINMSKI
jgi:hypothetical protein